MNRLTTIGWLLVAFLFGGGILYLIYNDRPENTVNATPKPISENSELATFGGGCFWCLEAAFEMVNGVERVESGYAGGATKNPTYRQVCTGTTGHAEVVQIAYDPKVVGFKDLVQIFFVLHDPTTLNSQGPDHGTQYRSAIFYHSPEQKQIAESVIDELTKEKIWDRPIVTQVAPLDTFYRAEDYHQGYFRANPKNPYCLVNTTPKIAKLRKHFQSKLKQS